MPAEAFHHHALSPTSYARPVAPTVEPAPMFAAGPPPAMRSCASYATRFAWVLVRRALVATTPSVVFWPLSNLTEPARRSLRASAYDAPTAVRAPATTSPVAGLTTSPAAFT